MDDLYNNLKVYEPEVKGMSSLSSSTQNMAFVSSSNNNTSSTNEAVNTAHGVSTASTQVNAPNSTNIDNLSDAIICAFFASQPNSPQLVHEDLQQIHPDDMEEMDLRWQMAMLTMRARSLKWSDTTATRGDILLGSVELQEIKTTRTRKAQEGSDQAEEGPNYALMAYSSSCSDSEVSNDSNCLKSCMETVKLLKSQNDQLLRDLEKSSLMVLGYKTGLESMEEKLEIYKKNESVYVENINGLKWDIQVGEITIRELRKKLEKVQKEKDSIQFNVDKFENASKSLNKLIECQIVDNCKKHLGYEKYNVVPPPYTGNFMPPTPDLSFIGLDEFVNKPVVENRKYDEEVSKKTVKPSIAKIEFVKPKQQKKTAKKTVKQVEKHRVNHQNSAKKTHPCTKKNFIPRAVLMKSGLVLVNTARQVNAAHSKTIVNASRPISYLSKIAHSTVKRPIHKNTTFKNSNINKRVNTARDKKFNTARPKAVVNDVKGNFNAVKASACWVWKPKIKVLDHVSKHNSASITLKKFDYIDAHGRSKCSRHMTRNMSYLTNYEEIDGGYVAFGGNPKGGKITRKCTIKTGNLDFENVYFVRELKFNLFSVSQMCDKKNSVLFNDTECIVLSPNFKLIDESQVLLRVPRKNNMYSVDLKNIVPKGGLTCLFAKATSDESKLWHRRLGHLNFKTMNKLVKGNLVRGLPSKLFENDQTCVACQKGKQHRASCKSKTENSISLPLHLLHMDLFGPTFVKSLMKKMYCLVVTDDYSRFTWVFFLATKDETSGILKSFITRIENLVDHKVKVIRCDNGTEFKNREMNQFCEMKGILRQFSVARTPQQNRVAKRRNRTLIKAARTMLADSKLPTTFWAEAVNTACYVQNRVLVVKPYNKTPYELFHGRTPTLSFMRPFGCPVTILNTIDHLGKFDGKADEGSGPDWLFDIDALTRIMNYEPIVAGTQSNGFAGTKASDNAGQARKETEPVKDYILLPLWTVDPTFSKIKVVNAVGGKTSIELPFDPNMPTLEDVSIFDLSKDNDDVGAEVDINNLDTTIQVSPIPTTRIHKDHPLDQVIGDLQLPTQIKKMSKNLEEHGFVIHALKDPSWIKAMQEELLQFKIQEVWTLVDLPNRKRVIGSKWIFRNKKDERGIVIRNKARLVAQWGFEDPDFPDRVYKVEKALYGLHQAPRAWYETLSTYLLDNRFQRGKIGKTLFIKRHKGDILLNFKENLGLQKSRLQAHQWKLKSLLPHGMKNDGEWDVHMYRSIIGSLMYLTSSRNDICLQCCAPVTRLPKSIQGFNLHAMKGIFRYLKGQPKLGLWYPKDSSFDLEAYIDSDYARASLDGKSTTRYCQFLGSKLISWQFKKQTVVPNSTTKAEYVAASSCCGQVL
ncbi:putative ribonuclease H-like domain-containing protein [Tanacetum coccineum]